MQLEEPSEHALGDEVPPQVTQTPAGQRKVVFELEKSDQDTAFELWCFLQDLGDVRIFVKQAWEEYSRGDISFLAASSITDTAFGLLRCADEDFTKSSSLKSSDWPGLVEYLEIFWFVRGRAVWLCPNPHVKATQPRIPDSDINIVELLCPLAFLCLESYRQDAEFVCQHYRSFEGTTGRTPHPVVECHVKHMHDICCVFGDLAPGLYHISHCSTHKYKLVDEFVEGLASLHHSRKFPMWLVVACQIYLDIYDLLGDHLDHGVQALSDTFSRNVQVAADVREYQSSCRDAMADVVTAVDRLEWIASAAIRFDSTINDPIDKIDSANDLQVKEEVGSAASTMEKSLPAYAGALLTDIKVGLHEVGCIIANHNAIVLSTAHLYKALRAMRVLDVDWHDMDFVLASFGIKQPLVAKVGGQYDGEAAYRHYFMALGMSAQEFTADARARKKPPTDVKRVPQITVTSTLLRVLCDRQNSWQRHGIGHSKSRMIEAVLHALTEDIATDNAKKPGTGSHLKPVFTPHELLATFKKRLLHDEPRLNFDFTSFTLSCARLLSRVATTLQPTLNLGPKDTESHYHFVLISRLLRSPPASTAIRSTATLLRAHIDAHGKTHLQHAYDQSSGRIPRALRPRIAEDQARAAARRELVKTMFDSSRTRYSFAGPLVAAYHPGIQPERCCTQANCRESFPGGETDPAREANERAGRNVGGFGSAIPRAIVELSRGGVDNDGARGVPPGADGGAGEGSVVGGGKPDRGEELGGEVGSAIPEVIVGEGVGGVPGADGAGDAEVLVDGGDKPGHGGEPKGEEIKSAEG